MSFFSAIAHHDSCSESTRSPPQQAEEKAREEDEGDKEKEQETEKETNQAKEGKEGP